MFSILINQCKPMVITRWMDINYIVLGFNKFDVDNGKEFFVEF